MHYSPFVAALTGLSPNEFQRYYSMTQDQKEEMAGEKVKKVIAHEYGGKMLHVYQQDSDEITMHNKRWVWKPVFWVNAHEIADLCGATDLRLKHCLSRMKSNTFEFKDKKRQKKVRRETNRKRKVHDLQVKEGKSSKREYWITARATWSTDSDLPVDAINYIIETFATRRPYLPEGGNRRFVQPGATL